jgi:hypothetical protein
LTEFDEDEVGEGGPRMRFLFRIALLALAAVGAKALYERFRPAVEGATSGSGSAVLQPAKHAIHEVTDHAKTAAAEVAEHARSAATEAASETRDQLRDSAGDSSNASATNS